MKHIYIIIFSLLLNIEFNAQQWEWARKLDNLSSINAVKIYPCGNSGFYLSGWYIDSLSIDAYTIYKDTNLRPLGSPETSGFLARFDINGQCLWLKNIFVNMGACTDAASNIYITGLFASQITLDGITLHSSRGSAAVIAKISSSGNLLNLENVDGAGARCHIGLNSLSQLIVATGVYDSLSYRGSVFRDSTGLVLKLDSNLNLLQYSQSNAFAMVAQLELDMNDSIYMVVNKFYPCMYCGVCRILKYTPDLNLAIVHGYSSSYGPTFYYDPLIKVHAGSIYVFKYGNVTKYNTQLNNIWTKTPPWGGWLFSKNNKLFLVGVTSGMNCGDYIKRSSIISELDTALNCLEYKSLPIDSLQTGYGPYFMEACADDYNTKYLIGMTDQQTGFDSITISGTPNKNAFFIAKLKYDVVPNAIRDYKSVEMISVFPNPTSGVFTISFNNKTMEAKICVYDILGNCLSNKVLKNKLMQEIDLSGQAKGVYFIEVVTNEQRLTKKLVLE